MNEHLSKEDLELLSMSETPKSIGLFEALEHLEHCDKCRAQIKLPTKEEILKRFELTDEEEKVLSSSSSPSASAPVQSHSQKK